LYDSTHAFPPGTEEIRVQIALELERETETLDILVELLEGTRLIARGGGPVDVTQGTVTTAPVLADPVSDNLAVGDKHACYLDVNGAAFCWGLNSFGQLGTGDSTGSSLPVRVTGGRRYTAIAAGTYSTCALEADGAAYCWGSNAAGQLGDGTRISSNQPVAVTGGLRFRQVSQGASHTCGLTIVGDLYCWGSNAQGALAISQASSFVPVPAASGFRFEDVDAAFWSTCGVSSNAAYCWGRLPMTSASSPTLVPGGVPFVLVRSGLFHACGLTADGSAYCWGEGQEGLIGNGTFSDAPQPTPVSGGLSFESIAMSRANSFFAVHACGITRDGSAHCWGLNRHGQLGSNGNLRPCTLVYNAPGAMCSPVPLAVSGGLRFAAIGVGSEHTCAIANNGRVYCWGSGIAGNLGVGDFNDRSMPTAIGAPISSPTLDSLAIDLASANLAVGDSVSVRAYSANRAGVAVPVPFTWTSSDTVVVKLGVTLNQPQGQPFTEASLVARARGSAVITLSARSKTASRMIVVN
jgi:alpha-tubulin suppressor-like RCC1 family protein